MEIQQGIKPTLIKGVLVIGGSYLAFKLAKKAWEEIQKYFAEKETNVNSDFQQATALHSAMNPSGFEWLKDVDGTKSATILEIAKTIVNLKEVAEGYRKNYSGTLLDDLRRELSVSDYDKFLTIVNSNPNKVQTDGQSPPVQFVKAHSYIVATKPVSLRSSPDASNHNAFYEFFSEKNILRTAKSGEFIGYATGQQKFDEKNNVKFIQVGFTVDKKNAPKEWKSKAGQKVLFWVSASSNYIEQYPTKEAYYKYYPQGGKYLFWMRPLVAESKKTLKGIVATDHTTILNESFQPVGIAQPQMLLGEVEMVLNTDTGKFLRFRTTNNQSRWVQSKNTSYE